MRYEGDSGCSRGKTVVEGNWGGAYKFTHNKISTTWKKNKAIDHLILVLKYNHLSTGKTEEFGAVECLLYWLLTTPVSQVKPAEP